MKKKTVWKEIGLKEVFALFAMGDVDMGVYAMRNGERVTIYEKDEGLYWEDLTIPICILRNRIDGGFWIKEELFEYIYECSGCDVAAAPCVASIFLDALHKPLMNCLFSPHIKKQWHPIVEDE